MSSLWLVGWSLLAMVLGPQPGAQVAQSIPSDQAPDGHLHFWLYLPPDYQKQPGKSWPLLLFLHGAGERGSQLQQVKRHGPPKLIDQGRSFPLVVVSPQCPRGKDWRQLAPSLLKLLDHLEKHYRIDPTRVYITGLSMGGYGTWHLVALAPERFAAAVPICGGGDPRKADRIKQVPIWAFHGARDRVVPLKRSQEMVQAVRQAGGEARLTVYPQAGHDSWTATYENEEVYRWLLQHRKKRPRTP